MRRNGAFTAPAEIAPAGQALDTPFLRAKREWDERTGSLLKQKANWQRATAALTVAVVVLACTIAVVARQVTVQAYVVEVAESGQIRTVGIVPQAWQGQHLAPVEFVVRQWLMWVRTISSDPVVFAQHWDEARDFMTDTGWTLLRAHIQQQQERLQRGDTVQIKFGTMLPVAGHARSFEVEWEERAYGPQGYALAHNQWKAIVKIAVFPPQDITLLKELRNPLGIFIEEVQWSERVTDRRNR